MYWCRIYSMYKYKQSARAHVCVWWMWGGHPGAQRSKEVSHSGITPSAPFRENKTTIQILTDITWIFLSTLLKAKREFMTLNEPHLKVWTGVFNCWFCHYYWCNSWAVHIYCILYWLFAYNGFQHGLYNLMNRCYFFIILTLHNVKLSLFIFLYIFLFFCP